MADETKQELIDTLNRLVVELEASSAMGFFSEHDPLEIRAIVILGNHGISYAGCEILITCGGPTIWVESRSDDSAIIYGSWGGVTVERRAWNVDVWEYGEEFFTGQTIS